ncbi:MAG: hypothetical protein NXY57DRAFT_966935 [Lentinula lateritia]|nr:MAG: hypothetical protein NXY57DRAFT_966935 [Lentinula lateritia]
MSDVRYYSTLPSSSSPSPSSSSSPTFPSALSCSSSSSLSMTLRLFLDNPDGLASGISGGVLHLLAASVMSQSNLRLKWRCVVAGFTYNRTPLASLHLARDLLAPAAFAGSLRFVKSMLRASISPLGIPKICLLL